MSPQRALIVCSVVSAWARVLGLPAGASSCESGDPVLHLDRLLPFLVFARICALLSRCLWAFSRIQVLARRLRCCPQCLDGQALRLFHPGLPAGLARLGSRKHPAPGERHCSKWGAKRRHESPLLSTAAVGPLKNCLCANEISPPEV